ncbi:hypothetical protein AS850_11285 [Frondihabitans sp. 762G35]|uniref:winged helix DNA-binding domain-containing protein n=1 Tax=Frondihabitans sp. 762G35 TaxID=1446794 RepID=UPI000D20F51E|nr:winged helix DNA-binding domain-containing protein [Frondihabitans sp. 762G35]ARC57654.1 hypothetical protein AS850_11285 [Frondihabitans sp. 762G35]
MSTPDLPLTRVAAQGLGRRGFASVVEAAAGMLATQAQDLAGAKWALALRSSTSIDDVDEALDAGTLVRTWPMRGTLLVLAAADARWLTDLLAPRSFLASAGIWRRAGLDEEAFARARSVAADVLAGGGALGRTALVDALRDCGVDVADGRGAHILRRIAGDGVVVLGPTIGREQAFVLRDEWLVDSPRLERDEALAALAARYARSHGPATVHDLAWWSGLTVSDTRRAVLLAGEAVARDRDGLLVAPDAPRPARPGSVRLLPGFDELLLGYSDRTASLRPEDLARVVPTSNGLFLATVTLDGRVRGTWRRTLVGSDGVDVAVTLFPRGAGDAPGALSAEGLREAVADCAAAFAAAHRRALRLTITTGS